MGNNTPEHIDIGESAAGEEDPGASIGVAQKVAIPPARPRPGDEAPAGTPGTGEATCPVCGGSGKTAGRECPHCLGTGKVNVGIGGA